MSSVSQITVGQKLIEKLRETWSTLLGSLGLPPHRQAALQSYWYIPAALLLAGLVQFAVIPLTDILLETIYPPVKEKKLFGLYEKTVDDSRLAVRKGQSRLVWWLLSGGLAAGGGVLVFRQRRAGSSDETLIAQALPVSNQQRYILKGEIGRGTMGIVYAAYDTVLQREVAVKELPESLVQDDERRERFKREALLLAQLSHQGIVNIFDLIEDHERLMLVMELVEGGSLDRLLVPKVPMAVDDAVRLVLEMAEALEAIHARGIVHRDLKPANVLIDATGRLKITDFGLARLCQDSSLTVAGSIVGSPLYMSPEQAVGRPADQRSDIYALGAIFYLLLTGVPPFEGAPQEVLSQHLAVPPEPPGSKVEEIPDDVSALVMEMLEKVADERIDSCAKIVERLMPLMDPRAPSRKRRME